MRASVQIVSAPWAYPSLAPIQLGALGAYLERTFGASIDLGLHPVFLDAMLEVAGGDFIHFHDYWSETHRELISMLGFLARFGGANRPERGEIEQCLAMIAEEAEARRLRRGHSGRFSLSLDWLEALTDSVISLTDRTILPRLSRTGASIVGFSLNYSQVYMSGLIARRLKERFGGPLVFVFGGGSVSHPVVVDQIRTKIGVSGIVVLGEGERKLTRIVQTCLDAPEGTGEQALMAMLEDRDAGVFSVANPVDQTEHNPMFFRNQIHDLSALPPPDFRSYFASLRQACESQSVYEGLLDHVALSIEGTRGCFAKCDFCSLNRNWSGFRKRTGETVAKETLALRRAYPAGKVYFTDNVCDTWAEDYADALIAGGQRVRSHMQLRAHHPPSFWIKLALSGVEVVQIGVEALSAPLLSVISKGTKPVQNVRSLKLLAELGINCTDASNIITHHPRSTLADVAETRRVLEAILHFGTFSMVPFALVPGAPIYEELSREEKDQLRIDPRVPLPGALSSYLVEKHMTKPTHWRDPERDEAWDAVVTWYFAEKAKETGGSGLRLLESTPEQVWLQGYQAGRFTEIVLDGLDAAIVDACHEGPSTEQLAGTLGLTTAELMPMLDGLAELGILLAIGGHYLTVALRSRDTVLLRYFRETGPVGRDDGALPDAGAIIPPFHPELTPAEAGKGRR